MPAGRDRPSSDHAPAGPERHLDVDPDEAVGDFGDAEQSDAGGDSDPDAAGIDDEDDADQS